VSVLAWKESEVGSRATKSQRSDLSALSTSNRHSEKWSTLAAVPVWLRSGPILRICSRRKRRTEKSVFGTELGQKQEIYYQEYFNELAERYPNFSFHLALSSPLPDDAWTGLAGFIHEVAREEHLSGHSNPQNVEYYLCGPPFMIKAVTKMLAELGVPTDHVAFDEF